MIERMEYHTTLEACLADGLAHQVIPAKVTFDLERADPRDIGNPLNTDDITDVRLWLYIDGGWTHIPSCITRAFGLTGADPLQRDTLLDYAQGRIDDSEAREMVRKAA